jgi:hypothetical protein
MRPETRIAQRKRLLLKLDMEYQLFLDDLKRERARMAEEEKIHRARIERRQARAGGRNDQVGGA